MTDETTLHLTTGELDVVLAALRYALNYCPLEVLGTEEPVITDKLEGVLAKMEDTRRSQL